MKVENKDIIITDPCYITKEGDWEKCGYGDNIKILGITNHLTSSTGIGDWAWEVVNIDNGEVIGKFCADAGMTSVFELDEVLDYNPDFDYHLERTWTTTLIKNFIGEITSYFDGDGMLVIIGKGNVNFRSVG